MYSNEYFEIVGVSLSCFSGHFLVITHLFYERLKSYKTSHTEHHRCEEHFVIYPSQMQTLKLLTIWLHFKVIALCHYLPIRKLQATCAFSSQLNTGTLIHYYSNLYRYIIFVIRVFHISHRLLHQKTYTHVCFANNVSLSYSTKIVLKEWAIRNESFFYTGKIKEFYKG